MAEHLLSTRDAITELTLAHQAYFTNGQPGTADGRAALSVLKTLLDTIYAALVHVHAISGVTGLQAALTALGVDTAAVASALAAHGHSFASLSSKPTTLAGYGIVDAYPLTGNPSAFLTTLAFAALTGKPTSLAGYGILDAYPLSGNPSGFLTSVPDLSAIYSVLAHTHPVPPIVNLTDVATVAVNAALRGPFRLTIGGNRTLGNPTNLVDGQIFTVEIVQTSGGHTLALDTKYNVGPDVSDVTLSTGAGARDKATFQYNQTVDLIDVLAFVHL